MGTNGLIVLCSFSFRCSLAKAPRKTNREEKNGGTGHFHNSFLVKCQKQNSIFVGVLTSGNRNEHKIDCSILKIEIVNNKVMLVSFLVDVMVF